MRRGMLASPLELNEPVDPGDRFAYGWRYVKKVAKNGSETTVQVPLTLEDILHPQEEDFRVLSDPHWQDTTYLYGAFKIALAETPGACVLGDCRVAWDKDGKYGHGPDVTVIFKVRKKKRWSTFNVMKEKTRPSLIVEVTSPNTRSTDLVNKVREYAEQGVPHYVIADAKETEDSRQVSLIDYHLSPEGGTYFSLPLDEEGRLWLDEVKLWLSVEDGRLVCTDAKGKRIGTTEEERRARDEAEKRVEKEQQARHAEREKAAQDQAALQERIKELEDRLRHTPHTKGRNGMAKK